MNKEKQKFTLGFIFDKKLERVLLIKKIFKSDLQKDLAQNLSGKLNGLGGKCEPNETPPDCIKREVKEESGLELNNWVNFCNLDAKFGYVYCFYNVIDNFIEFIDGKPELIYKQMEDEFLDVHLIENGYKFFLRMNNLDWLIPMALNHYKKLDSCELFEIREIYSQDGEE